MVNFIKFNKCDKRLFHTEKLKEYFISCNKLTTKLTSFKKFNRLSNVSNMSLNLLAEASMNLLFSPLIFPFSGSEIMKVFLILSYCIIFFDT